LRNSNEQTRKGQVSDKIKKNWGEKTIENNAGNEKDQHQLRSETKTQQHKTQSNTARQTKAA
jgi:hypothetical protein